MSDIRFNQWLHNSGTGGVSQVDGGHVGIGTTNPLIPVGAGVTAVLNVGVVTANYYYGDGSNLSGIVGAGTSLSFNDNIGAYFGNSQDLKIYHDGNHSYIDDQGTGNLRLRSGTLEILNLAGNKTSAIFSSGGAQTLNFNNNTKFVTTNTGIDVTGSVVADDLVITGPSVVADLKSTNNNYVLGLAGNNASDKVYLGTTSGNDFILANTSSVTERLRITSGGVALFGGLTSQTSDTSKLAVQGGDSNIGIIQVHAGGGENSGDLSGIAFSHGTDNTTARAKCAIASRATGAYGRGDLCFYVDGAGDNNQVSAADEKLRITSGGQVNIGVASPQYAKKVNIQGGNDATISLSNQDYTGHAAGSQSGIEGRLQCGGGIWSTSGVRFKKENGTSGDKHTRLELYATDGYANKTGLIVHPDGEVTKPSNPKFWAKSNNAQTLNGNGTNYIKNYQDEIFDIGNCYDGTNAFTAPITGYYHFGWSFMMQGGNADGFTYVFGAPLISGNDIAQEVMSPRSGGANYVSVVGSHLLYLTSGQYVQIRMRQSGGNPVSIRSDQAYFWGYLVG